MLSQECFHRFDFSRGPLWKFTWLKYTGDFENSTEHLQAAWIFVFPLVDKLLYFLPTCFAV
jgi:hypothetical protein